VLTHTPFASGVYKKGSVEPSVLISAVKDESGQTGALLSFVGVVKAVGVNGKKVSKVVMEAYDKEANNVITAICVDLVTKYALSGAYIYHFVGEFGVGDPLIVIVIASKSRWEAYDAMKEAVHRYKTEPPIWKKEVYEDGSGQWISEE
jgi:molybdopterin synthase catalytic subunit